MQGPVRILPHTEMKDRTGRVLDVGMPSSYVAQQHKTVKAKFFGNVSDPQPNMPSIYISMCRGCTVQLCLFFHTQSSCLDYNGSLSAQSE